MSRPIAKYPANPAFGKLNEPLNASEYIRYKKTKYSFCAPNICHPNKNVYSQSNLMDLKTANKLAFYPCGNFDTNQLYSNLYSTMDLNGNVLVIANMIGRTYPAPISETLPAFLTYYVDLSGNLFGNTVCGTNNYENYLVYNYPYQQNN